jgi:hypothetical protein
MILFVINIVAITALGLLVWRRGRDRRVRIIKSAHWLRIAGLVPLGMQVVIFLLFGIGEMASGDLSGAGHLFQVAATVLLGMLAWMRPLEGGIALFAGAALFIVSIFASISLSASTVISPAIMVMAAPQMVSGVLFFIAGMLARSAPTPRPDQDK